MVSHDDCKRSEGDRYGTSLYVSALPKPQYSDTHHRQDFILDMEELCVLSVGNIKFQGDLAHKYSY